MLLRGRVVDTHAIFGADVTRIRWRNALATRRRGCFSTASERISTAFFFCVLLSTSVSFIAFLPFLFGCCFHFFYCLCKLQYRIMCPSVGPLSATRHPLPLLRCVCTVHSPISPIFLYKNVWWKYEFVFMVNVLFCFVCFIPFSFHFCYSPANRSIYTWVWSRCQDLFFGFSAFALCRCLCIWTSNVVREVSPLCSPHSLPSCLFRSAYNNRAAKEMVSSILG